MGNWSFPKTNLMGNGISTKTNVMENGILTKTNPMGNRIFRKQIWWFLIFLNVKMTAVKITRTTFTHSKSAIVGRYVPRRLLYFTSTFFIVWYRVDSIKEQADRVQWFFVN